MRLLLPFMYVHAYLALAPDGDGNASVVNGQQPPGSGDAQTIATDEKQKPTSTDQNTDSTQPQGPPPPLGQTMQNLADTVKRVVPPADNSAALEAMTAEGIQDSEDAIQVAEGNDLLERIVNAMVDARLNTLFLTGLCPRNYTITCPTGWTETVPGLQCDNPSGDPSTTPPGCQQFYPKQYSSPVLKADFATKCKVQWPCAACTKDFSNCPRQFRQVEEATKGLCMPRKKYLGPCPEVIDFRKFPDDTEKAKWATRCYTEWPCSPE